MKKKLFILILFFSIVSIQTRAQEIEVKCDRNEKGELDFTATNNSQRPYFVVMLFSGLTGSLSITPDHVTRVDPGIRQLCTVKPLQGNSTFSSYSYRYYTSDPSTKIDPDYPYLIPLKNGASTKAFQVTNISTILSRGNPANWYCMGFSTNAGDTICASRGGIVVESKMSVKEKDRDAWFNREVNYVIILHEDGTLARYSHLADNKVFPEVGDKIFASQPIGLASAGNSQRRSHVYLLVYHANIKSNETDCILTKFCVTGIKPEILLHDNNYVARHFPEVVTKGMSRKMKKKYLGE